MKDEISRRNLIAKIGAAAGVTAFVRRGARAQQAAQAAIESAAQTDTDEMPSPFAARVECETTRRGFDIGGT